MNLYPLGKVPWMESQLIYHALARLGRESLVLVSPASPYVCIGYHQDVDHEVNMDFCRAHRIPVFRREVGGGAVYLDGNQLFFQLILREDNPMVPPSKKAFYQKFLRPVIEVYRRIGIPAEYRPINDIVVGHKKISGTGVGEIAQCIVFVGNLIVDFNYEMMSKILKVPDEKFRDKVKKSIKENLSTIRRELGKSESARWHEDHLNALLADAFSSILGPLTPCDVDARLAEKMDELKTRMGTDRWLYHHRKAGSVRPIRIRSGVLLTQRIHKAPGGLLRLEFELVDGVISSIAISGDFFCFPEDGIHQLVSMLKGKNETEIEKVLIEYCDRQDIEIPGVGLQDWMMLFGKEHRH